jgi:molecular chaperone GrpE
MAALSGFGLAAFGAEGDDFDPSLHEAVQHEGQGSKPVIGSVLRQGYKLGDQVLRHALVGVVDTDEPPETGGDDAESPDTPDNDGKSGEQTAESESSAS